MLLGKEKGTAGEAYNFGPDENVIKSVRDLVDGFLAHWGAGKWEYSPARDNRKEATLLRLNCDKAGETLKWRPVLDFDETVELTARWYKNYYDRKDDVNSFACSQIDEYVEKAVEKGLSWARGNES